jgi:hypothetical protein
LRDDCVHPAYDSGGRGTTRARQRWRGAGQPLATGIVVGGEMDAGVQVEALVHRGVGQARWRLRKLGLGKRTARRVPAR